MANKPTKPTVAKAGRKQRAKKKTKAVVADIAPMADLVVMIKNPGRRAMRLAAEAGPTQYVQVTLDGSAHAKLIKALLSDPGRVSIQDIPVPTTLPEESLHPFLDQVLLTEDIIDLMMPLMTASDNPSRDRGFLVSSLVNVTALLGYSGIDVPESIRALSSTDVDGMPVLYAQSFCALMCDDHALDWIRNGTKLRFGPRTQEVLKNLSHLLSSYYRIR